MFAKLESLERKFLDLEQELADPPFSTIRIDTAS